MLTNLAVVRHLPLLVQVLTTLERTSRQQANAGGNSLEVGL